MDRLPAQVDVAVVGAGTSGAAAAALCAERGLTVLCIDRGPLAGAGARWVNGVPRWMFAAAGIDAPQGPELHAEGARFHLVAGAGPERVVVGEHDVCEVDMPHLVARLQARAVERGATLVGEVGARGVDGDVLMTDAGEVSARCIVDAAGLTGPRLLGQAVPEPGDLCTAAQELRACTDARAAKAFFERHGAALGDVLCFSGVAGGYSIVNLRSDGRTVGILTGSIPGEGRPSGRVLLERAAAQEPWIGETLQGGSRALPLGRPHDVLARGHVALLGDSGRQVFAAHGSGIGAGLVAARLLADTLVLGRSPRAYAVAWQRRWGGLFAASDLFRRVSQALSGDDVARLFRAGLVDAAIVGAGLAQRVPRLSPAALPAKLRALAGEPRLGARLLAAIARMAAVRAAYARYPTDPAAVPAWSRAVARAAGA